MIRTGVVGVSGYSGLELLRFLLGHPHVEVAKYFGNASAGMKIDDVHPSLKHRVTNEIEEIKPQALSGLDLLFVALPSGQAMGLVPQALDAGCRVIDLGGDFRLTDPEVYKKYYGHEHTATELLGAAVYGLSEWNSSNIGAAKLVANPGCYPTSIQLALLPLVKSGVLDTTNISITSYSGTSGAGKSIMEKLMFSEVNGSVRAYKVGNHQHVPEIRKYLDHFGGRDVDFTFVPHLLPVTRGIYTTIHAKLVAEADESMVSDAYSKFYRESPFVRVIAPSIPEMKDVLHSNFCDISYFVNDESRSIVVLSTIDNLVKGAAGQAVQNMNMMFGFPQTEGLLPCFKK